MLSGLTSTSERCPAMEGLRHRIISTISSVSLIAVLFGADRCAALEIVLDLSQISPAAQDMLREDLNEAVAFWESRVIGYHPDVVAGHTNNLPSLDDFPLQIRIDTQLPEGTVARSGPAAVSDPEKTGGFSTARSGMIALNPTRIERLIFQDRLDELLLGSGDRLKNAFIHEIGHAFGLGPSWLNENLVSISSGGQNEYIGVHGVARMQSEFGVPDSYILADSVDPGHWNDYTGREQPIDSQDRLFKDDLLQAGRNLNLASGFVSDTSVASMQDLGFIVEIPKASSLFKNVIESPAVRLYQSAKLSPSTEVNVRSGGVVPLDFSIGPGAGTADPIVLNLLGGIAERGTRVTPGTTYAVYSGLAGGSIDVQNLGSLQVAGGLVGDFVAIGNGGVLEVWGGELGNRLSLSGGFARISGGFVGNSALVQDSGVLTVTGGEVGDFLEVQGATANLLGGQIGSGLDMGAGSQVIIDGATIGTDADAFGGSQVRIRSGVVDEGFRAGVGSYVEISGGTVRRGFRGSGFSEIEIVATRFFLGGQDITPSFGSTVLEERGVLLTAFLLDGTVLSWELSESSANDPDYWISRNATLRLTLGNSFTPGDLNGDGVVSMDDYDTWVSEFGSPSSLAGDANRDGRVDAADYTVWRDNYESGSAEAIQDSQVVPESQSVLLMSAVTVALAVRRKLRSV